MALTGNSSAWQFSLVFLFSAFMQTMSLWYVKRIPDVTAPEALKRSGHRVPWGAMLTHPPFFRLMVFNLLYYAAMCTTSGLAVFTVAYLKSEAGFSESRILWLSAVTILGALGSVTWVAASWIAAAANLCCACMLAFCIILAGWWAVASGVAGKAMITIALLSLMTGVAQANWSVANNRLMMATMPLMGRNHFFALFIVITNVGLGLSPHRVGAAAGWHRPV